MESETKEEENFTISQAHYANSVNITASFDVGHTFCLERDRVIERNGEKGKCATYFGKAASEMGTHKDDIVYVRFATFLFSLTQQRDSFSSLPSVASSGSQRLFSVHIRRGPPIPRCILWA